MMLMYNHHFLMLKINIKQTTPSPRAKFFPPCASTPDRTRLSRTVAPALAERWARWIEWAEAYAGVDYGKPRTRRGDANGKQCAQPKTEMSTSPIRLLYACRDNDTHTLLPCDGAPRSEKYCRVCIPLRGDQCCLLSESQIAQRRRELGLAPAPRPRCAECGRPNQLPRFKNCPRCRAKARRRMRRIKR